MRTSVCRILLLITAATAALHAVAITVETPAERRRLALRLFEQAEHLMNVDENYGKAMEQYYEFLKLSDTDSTAFSHELPAAYMGLGAVAFYYNDLVGALQCFDKGLRWAEESGDAEAEVKLLNNRATVLSAMKRHDEAWHTVERLMRVEGGSEGFKQYAYHTAMGRRAQAEGRFDEAVKCWLRSVAVVDSFHLEPYTKNYQYSYLADCYRQMGMADSVLHYLRLNYDLCRHTHHAYSMIDCARRLLLFHAERGDMAGMRQYTQEYFHLTDSLMNPRQYMSVRSMNDAYEQVKTGKKIRDLTFTISWQKALLLAVIAVLALVVGVLLIVNSHRRKLKRAYKVIYQRNKELLERYRQEREERGARSENTEQAQNVEERGAGSEEREHRASPNCCAINYSRSPLLAPRSSKIKLPDPQKAPDEARANDEELCRRIQEVLDNTDECCKPDFGLASLTALVGSNTSYVSRVVNDHFGKTLPTVVNEYRIRRACSMMQDIDQYGNLTLQAIGEMVGFRSRSNFIRLFKQVVGITPSVYMQMAREDHQRQDNRA